jgi:hypothetical protein
MWRPRDTGGLGRPVSPSESRSARILERRSVGALAEPIAVLNRSAVVFVGGRSRERGAALVEELGAAGHQLSFMPTDVNCPSI